MLNIEVVIRLFKMNNYSQIKAGNGTIKEI